MLSALKLPDDQGALTVEGLVSHKRTACFLPAGFLLVLCMDTASPMIHHGRNVKRIREILGVKQDFLATSLGLSQQAISQLEQKEVLDKAMLQKLSKALGVTEEAIENFNDDAAVTIISSTLHDQSGSINYSPTFNPIDKIVELYERMLAMEQKKNELLQKLLDAKS